MDSKKEERVGQVAGGRGEGEGRGQIKEKGVFV